jgi:hypothetical protein
MTQQMERPLVTEAESAQDWMVELCTADAYRESIDFLMAIRKEQEKKFARDRREIQLARIAREQEDAWQEARREEIRAENEAAAAAVTAQACPTCFCLHAGEC